MQNAGSAQARSLRYVALGDSYTIGTSVDPNESWPSQLVARLAASSTQLALVANLGVDGFTSADVIDAELPRLGALDAEFLSILIGVNDVVQGVPAPRFRANTATILDALLQYAPARRIVAVATPDYTVTPEGPRYGDRPRRSAGIRTNNAILQELSHARGIAFVDIYDLSLRASTDRSLVAADGLHPSGAQYGLWVDRIAPVVERLLSSEVR